MRKFGLKLCLGLGIGLAILLSAIVSVVYGLGGGQELRSAGLGLKEALGVYAFGGVTGGFIFWLMQPLGRTKGGGALVGCLCLLPSGLATAFFLSAGGASAVEAYLGTTVGMAILGALIGYAEGGI